MSSSERKVVLSQEEKNGIIATFEEKLQKEKIANEIYQELLESFGYAKFDVEGRVLSGKVELCSSDYPDYYGGSYVNEQGNLVVNVVGTLVKCKNEIEQLVSVSGEYILKQVLYPYKKLLHLVEKINQMLIDENLYEFENVASYFASEKENAVIVELLELDEVKIDQFKGKISDSSMIVFRQGEYDEPATTVAPGQGVQNASHIYGMSIGYRARVGGVNGFITTGHGTRLNHRMRVGSTDLGQITRHRYVNHGNIDAAWSNLSSGNTIVNHVNQDRQLVLGTPVTSAATGTTVFFAGRNHVQVRIGSVSGTGLTITLSGNSLHGSTTLINQSRAMFLHAPMGGDSGGTVYRTISAGDNRIVGVIVSTQGAFSLRTLIDNNFGSVVW